MRKFIAFLLAFSIMILCVSCGTAKNTQEDLPATDNQGITITDYYNESGEFSDLGLVLEEENTERVLKVDNGNILIVGGKRYVVTAESLTLPFYTQPSYAEVIGWWTEYLNNLVENGEITAE